MKVHLKTKTYKLSHLITIFVSSLSEKMQSLQILNIISSFNKKIFFYCNVFISAGIPPPNLMPQLIPPMEMPPPG